MGINEGERVSGDEKSQDGVRLADLIGTGDPAYREEVSRLKEENFVLMNTLIKVVDFLINRNK